MELILEAINIKAGYRIGEKIFIDAVSNVSLNVKANEVLGIAGESGCGKSTLIKVLYGYISPPLQVVRGSIYLHVDNNIIDILNMSEEDRRNKIWWKYISYIPQNSMNVLNPTMRIWEHFAEVITKFERISKQEIKAKAIRYAENMGLPPDVINAYPHQLSGGMRQRVITALALVGSPLLVLADEPTTALDVVVQRRILQHLLEYQKRNKSSLVIVTHDMGIHAMTTNRIVIMYAGKISEIGKTEEVFKQPLHPYTQALINSLPRIGDRGVRRGLSGSPPDLKNPPPGCRFHPRCPFAMDICRREEPPVIEFERDRYVSCWLYVKR